MEEKKIKVRVKQAHREVSPNGYKDHPVGEVLEINEKDFADNLHEKMMEVKEDGTRAKKR